MPNISETRVSVTIREDTRYLFDIPADEIDTFRDDPREWLATHDWTAGADAEVLQDEILEVDAS